MPDVKVYIRQENLEAWNSITAKSEWVNAKLSGTPTKTKEPLLGDYLPSELPIKQPVAKRLPDIPGLGVASDLAEPECKRHHQPVSMCARLH